MNVSSISNSNIRNSFIKYANRFMSFKSGEEDGTTVTKPEIETEKKFTNVKGLETLTIFPKQVIDGKTVITA
ncbi:hypothetical protein IJ182_06640 [bacterium]|nr:hypothetical protein [bacterium]